MKHKDRVCYECDHLVAWASMFCTDVTPPELHFHCDRGHWEADGDDFNAGALHNLERAATCRDFKPVRPVVPPRPPVAGPKGHDWSGGLTWGVTRCRRCDAVAMPGSYDRICKGPA